MCYRLPTNEHGWRQLAKLSALATLALAVLGCLPGASGLAIFLIVIAFSVSMSAWGMAVEARDAEDPELAD